MKFIHFGCWNQIDCEQRKAYRDIVLDYIKENEKQDDYDFMIVSGDNWYNNQTQDPSDTTDETKYKFYFTNILRTGLYKLYGIGKTCYMILGNHDEATDSNPPSDLKRDCMKNTLKYYIQEINKSLDTIRTPDLQDLAAFASDSSITAEDKTQLILYDCYPNVQIKVDDKNKNTVLIFINTNVFEKTNEEEVSNYLTQIGNALEQYPDRRKIVVGHNQILSQSVNQKGGLKTKKLCKNDETIKQFIDLLSSHKVVYLCADTHNVQITKLLNIVQVVVGTGGASPDVLPLETNSLNFSYDVQDTHYDITGYYHNSYGYSIIDINDTTGYITVTYKHIIDTNGNQVNKEYIYSITQDGKSQNINWIAGASEISPVSANIIATNNKSVKELCSQLTAENLVKNNSPDIKDSSNRYCYRGKK